MKEIIKQIEADIKQQKDVIVIVKMDDTITTIGATSENLSIYTFDLSGVTHSKAFQKIKFNVMNKDDLIDMLKEEDAITESTHS